MGFLDNILDRVRKTFYSAIKLVRSKIFGSNNERLDFIMDSFNKLPPQQQSAVLVGVGGVIFIFVVAVALLYVSRVNALSRELDESFSAYHELKNLKAEFQIEDKRFEKLLSSIDKKTRNVKYKPFFEKITKDLNLQMEGLSEEKLPLAVDNPLSEKVKEVKVTMRFPEISLPKLLNFLVEVEKSGKLLRIWDLQIRSRYGTKLFFTAEVEIRGYEKSL